LKELDQCGLCPRECGINRNACQAGYCGSGSGYEVASICIHHGEEPPISGIKGICNVFFSGCNLACVYCQNYQISRRKQKSGNIETTLEEVTARIITLLNEGIEAVGFVNPTHFTPHVKEIIRSLNHQGYKPITVYNTNCFDKVDIVRSLEGLIDVYLPDFKYMDPILASRFSDAEIYPEIAKQALLEMYRQKGSTVVLNVSGHAATGMIIRHLILPGQTDDSIRILEWIAAFLSPSVHISLMSQYYPTVCVTGDPVLGRKVTVSEYKKVVDATERLGFHKGWIQDHESAITYCPDFSNSNPFAF